MFVCVRMCVFVYIYIYIYTMLYYTIHTHIYLNIMGCTNEWKELIYKTKPLVNSCIFKYVHLYK